MTLDKLIESFLSAIEASGYAIVPVDDNSRDFADSNLPPAMIDAGMDALDETLQDPEIDWDCGMKAVACYRAMIAVATKLERERAALALAHDDDNAALAGLVREQPGCNTACF